MALEDPLLLPEQCSVPTELTPDAIQQLLLEAETRLRGSSNSHVTVSTDDELSLAPKLDNLPRKQWYRDLLIIPYFG